MALPAGRYGVTKRQLNKVKNLPVNTIGMIETTAMHIYADNGVLGAKNLIPFNLEQVKADNTLGTWSGNAYTYNGVTFTINTDGSIKITGTASAVAQLYLTRRTSYDFKLAKGSYIYNGVTSGSGTSYWCSIGKNRVTGDSSQGIVDLGNDYGNSLAFDLSETSDIQVLINVAKNYVCPAGGITIYPMIRLASDSDPTFQPYAQTNRELTVNKADNSVIATVENGATASQAYTVGSHFIRNGKFCTVIASISSGDTFTEGTNYSVGNVVDNLTKQATFSGTSSETTGNVKISNSVLHILSIKNTAGKIIIPYTVDSGTYMGTWAHVCNASDLLPAVSETINIEYLYI